jgi:hypothetical protein
MVQLTYKPTSEHLDMLKLSKDVMCVECNESTFEIPLTKFHYAECFTTSGCGLPSQNEPLANSFLYEHYSSSPKPEIPNCNTEQYSSNPIGMTSVEILWPVLARRLNTVVDGWDLKSGGTLACDHECQRTEEFDREGISTFGHT